MTERDAVADHLYRATVALIAAGNAARAAGRDVDASEIDALRGELAVLGRRVDRRAVRIRKATEAEQEAAEAAELATGAESRSRKRDVKRLLGITT